MKHFWSVTDSPAANRKVFDDTIMLHNAKVSDSAVYQCEASNKHGTLLSNANIMIMSKSNNLSFFCATVSTSSALLCFLPCTAQSRQSLCFTAIVRTCQPLHGVVYRLLTDVSRWRAGAHAGMCPWSSEERCLQAAFLHSGLLLSMKSNRPCSTIYMLTSSLHIVPTSHRHKKNMCCWMSADKIPQTEHSFCCHAQLYGVCAPWHTS